MSLVLALANQYGVVMSADRRTTTKTFNRDDELTEIDFSDYTKKIFITKLNHGIAKTGTELLKNNTPATIVIQDAIRNMPDDITDVVDELNYIKSKLQPLLEEQQKVTLICACIINGERLILSTDTNTNEILNNTENNKGYYAIKSIGEIARKFKTDIYSFPILKMADYLKFLNATVANFQKFSDKNQVVSEACDILAVEDDRTYWISSPDCLE